MGKFSKEEMKRQSDELEKRWEVKVGRGLIKMITGVGDLSADAASDISGHNLRRGGAKAMPST